MEASALHYDMGRRYRRRSLILVTSLHKEKKCGFRRLWNEIRNKRWCVTSISRLCKYTDNDEICERKYGTRRHDGQERLPISNG